MQDKSYMRRCIELGRAAARQGESPVGAIVLRNGRVIAEASERTKKDFDVTAHAEVLAIRGAPPKSHTRRLASVAIGLAMLYVVTFAMLMTLFHDKLGELIRLLQQMS